jgi:WD40 repeat protein
VNDVAFSPDGRRLLSGSDDGTLRLFDPASGTGTFLGGPGGRVVEVTFVGDRAVGGTATGKLWARDPANQAAVETPGHEAIVRALVPTAEGGLVSTSDDGNVRAWRPLFVSVGRSGAGHSGPVIAAAVGPDGSAWTGGEDGRVLRWTRDLGGAPKLYLKAAGPVVAIAVSGDGAWVAVASEQGPLRVLPTDIDERASEIRKLLEEMTVATFGHGDVLAGPWQ